MNKDINLSNDKTQNPMESHPSTESPYDQEHVITEQGEHSPRAERVEHVEEQSPDRLTWLQQDAIDDLRSRWTSIQAQFVDQPCASIEQADALLTDAMERIHQQLAAHQSTIRDRWLNKDDASTEDLRLTLQDYRSYLNHLLER